MLMNVKVKSKIQNPFNFIICFLTVLNSNQSEISQSNLNLPQDIYKHLTSQMSEYQQYQLYISDWHDNNVSQISLSKMDFVQEQTQINKKKSQQLSPQSYINKTAKQFFNNQTVNQNNFCEEGNFTNPRTTSRSQYFKGQQQSVQNLDVDSSYSQLDKYLKQIYQKHQILQLIQLFVGFQDSLIKNYEMIKKNLKKSKKMQISCFEEVNEQENFPFLSEENIINEFLFKIQSFLGVSMHYNDQSIENIKNEGIDFSFSSNKRSENKILNTENKMKHIHNSRSKSILKHYQAQKERNLITQKILKSIDLTKPIHPLDYSKIHEYTYENIGLKRTISQSVEQSISQNFQDSRNEELQKYENLLINYQNLKSQNLNLKKLLGDQKSKNYSNNSSFRQNQSKGDTSYMEQQKLVKKMQKKFQNQIFQYLKQQFKIQNNKRSQRIYNYIPDQEDNLLDQDEIPATQRKQLIITKSLSKNSELQNQSNINQVQIGKCTRVKLLEVKRKQNNINTENIKSQRKEMNQSMKRKTQLNSKHDTNKKIRLIESKQIENSQSSALKDHASNVIANNDKSQQNESIQKGKSLIGSTNQKQEKKRLNFNQIKIQVENIKINLKNNNYKAKVLDQCQSLLNESLMNKIQDMFKEFFKNQLEIQLVLFKYYQQNDNIKKSKLKIMFQQLIRWYSQLQIYQSDKRKGLNQFIVQCLNKKKHLLTQFKQEYNLNNKVIV